MSCFVYTDLINSLLDPKLVDLDQRWCINVANYISFINIHLCDVLL